MVIEWLEFDVPPRQRNAFIERDKEIWTEGLKQFKGFLGKEVWIDPDTERVILVIRWQSQQDWDAVPQAEIERLDKQMGNLSIPIAQSNKYQVRKYLQ
ncbi:MAG: TIGR03792 family protein [Microcoleaceae cyanobacterium]